jgi:isopentenyl-diphosphate delta-isomerase
MPRKTQTESRKKDHVELVVKNGAQYAKTSGFERMDFVHNALPEISPDSVDLSTTFLNKAMRYPIIMTGMTGGYGDAEKINKGLAAAAQKYGLALGVGSQRAMLEKPELAKTYKIRDVAPDIPLLANIGAFQLKKYPFEKIESLVQAIEADGLAIHLNALQEVIQPEGDTDFTGVLEAIRSTCEKLHVPVIVKETGAGISQDVALKLQGAGVAWLDVAGAGGTSWSRVEYMRAGAVPKKAGHASAGGIVPGFEDWGIPTAECIIQCRGVLPMIASGGIRNGVEGAKAIALGADLCGAAYPFVKALGEQRLDAYVETFQKQMRICAFLTGSRTLADLKRAKLIMR